MNQYQLNGVQQCMGCEYCYQYQQSYQFNCQQNYEKNTVDWCYHDYYTQGCVSTSQSVNLDTQQSVGTPTFCPTPTSYPMLNKQPRRITRTRFTAEQKEFLYTYFNQVNKSPPKEELNSISERLKVTFKVVKGWFVNQRCLSKKRKK
ncbi:hypothetical protein ACOME3_006447 [Neoechinorhynchus agilis]